MNLVNVRVALFHQRDARKGRHTAMRIKKDKKTLEQHYRDSMSFLERAEAGDRCFIVEEQELDGATLERVQLQDYTREAMSFLD